MPATRCRLNFNPAEAGFFSRMKISGTIFIFLMGALMAAAAEVDELISDLVDGDKVARREAARSLALIGPEAKAAVPALARALDDDEVQVFFWSATALANLGPAAHEATPELIKRLSRGGRRYRDQVRLRVVTALTRIGPAAVPQLIDALGDESRSIRSGAAKVLGNMGPSAHEAVPRLFALLADEENYIGETAGAALGKIGPAAHPQVLEALGSEEENIRAAAAVAIARRFGVEEAAIVEGLKSFRGLPHRMERVGEIAGVAFVNDSKATNPASTAPALAAFPPHAYIAHAMYIETETTPNPATLKFLPGQSAMQQGTREFANPEAAEASPLAQAIFDTGEVVNVFFGGDFVTVTAAPGVNWTDLKPQVLAILLDHFVAQAPLFVPGSAGGISVPPEEEGMMVEEREDDADIIAQINELLETRVRPAVASDGGDIQYRGYRDGVVHLQMQGACSGCPSSTATLKHGIVGLLKHYVPEVVEVRAS